MCIPRSQLGSAYRDQNNIQTHIDIRPFLSSYRSGGGGGGGGGVAWV